jgi:hypothetical protein
VYGLHFASPMLVALLRRLMDLRHRKFFDVALLAECLN